jgi:hypothetical protein
MFENEKNVEMTDRLRRSAEMSASPEARKRRCVWALGAGSDSKRKAHWKGLRKGHRKGLWKCEERAVRSSCHLQ